MALRRPGDIPLSLSPQKRVCTSPLAPVEGSLVGSDSSQVSPARWQGGARRERGPGRRDHPLPQPLSCSWSPCTSCSATARTTAPATSERSSGPAPSSRPGMRVHTSGAGALGMPPAGATWKGGKQGGTESLKCHPGQEERLLRTAGNVFTRLTSQTGQAGATSQTVATCGGEAVCVIDCQTGIVLHKYKVPGEVSASAWLLRGGQSLGSWGQEC